MSFKTTLATFYYIFKSPLFADFYSMQIMRICNASVAVEYLNPQYIIFLLGKYLKYSSLRFYILALPRCRICFRHLFKLLNQNKLSFSGILNSVSRCKSGITHSVFVKNRTKY